VKSVRCNYQFSIFGINPNSLYCLDEILLTSCEQQRIHFFTTFRSSCHRNHRISQWNTAIRRDSSTASMTRQSSARFYSVDARLYQLPAILHIPVASDAHRAISSACLPRSGHAPTSGSFGVTQKPIIVKMESLIAAAVPAPRARMEWN
jgi:hypothetical protein